MPLSGSNVKSRPLVVIFVVKGPVLAIKPLYLQKVAFGCKLAEFEGNLVLILFLVNAVRDLAKLGKVKSFLLRQHIDICTHQVVGKSDNPVGHRN